MSKNALAVDRCAPLEAPHVDDLKLAAGKMLGPSRRAFEAEMVLKYCEGNARQGELLFGWSRHTIETGLGEKRTGIVCLGAQEAFGGNKSWEEKHPEAAAALLDIAESQAQQDPSFRGSLAYTRLTAREAREQLRARGFGDALPAPSTMAEILNRHDYRLRPVLKAKPQKKSRKPMSSSPTSMTKMDTAATAAPSSACPWTARPR